MNHAISCIDSSHLVQVTQFLSLRCVAFLHNKQKAGETKFFENWSYVLLKKSNKFEQLLVEWSLLIDHIGISKIEAL